MQTVAFIGAGNMGSRMARRVASAGYQLVICDTSADARSAFEAEGVRTTTRPAETAAADLVILLVASDSQIDEVVFGEEGLIKGLDTNRRPIVMVMSTTLPSTVTAMHDRLAPLGVGLVDAPVSGGLVGAEQGTLAIMMGGSDAAVEAVLPVARTMGRNIFRCGPFGAPQAYKLINNMIGITNMYLANEAFCLAERQGIALEQLAPVLEVSTGRNYLSLDVEQSRRRYASWARDFSAFEQLSHITAKDLQLASKMARECGLELPVLGMMTRMLEDVSPDVFERWQRIGGLTPSS